MTQGKKSQIPWFMGFTFKSIIHRQSLTLYLSACSNAGSWNKHLQSWAHVFKIYSIPSFYRHQPNLRFVSRTPEQKSPWRSSSGAILPALSRFQFWDCPDGTVGGNGREEVTSVRTMSCFHSDFALGTCLLALVVPPEALRSLATNIEAIKCHPQDRDEKALFGFPWDGYFFLPWSCSRT